MAKQIKAGQAGPVGGKISDLAFINLSMLGVLAVMFILASLIVPRFFNINIIANLVSQQSILIILGIGVTFLLIAGYYDMSVGGIIALSAVLSAYFCQARNAGSFDLACGLGMSYGVAVALALAGCILIGLINAFFIVRMKINSVIVTLGTMAIARGIAMIVAKGAQRFAGLPDSYKAIGSITIVSTLDLAVVIMIVLLIIALIFENKTRFGKSIYLIGANQKAARLSGIKTGKILTLLYVISALLAGIAGIGLASRYNVGNCQLGTGFEFDALVITVLGGTSIFGGFGSVSCAVVGAFIIGILGSSVNMLGFPPSMQLLVKGFVIIAAILAQRFALNKRSL